MPYSTYIYIDKRKKTHKRVDFIYLNFVDWSLMLQEIRKVFCDGMNKPLLSLGKYLLLQGWGNMWPLKLFRKDDKHYVFLLTEIFSNIDCLILTICPLVAKSHKLRSPNLRLYLLYINMGLWDLFIKHSAK